MSNPFVLNGRELASIPRDYVPVTASASPLGFTTLGLYTSGSGNVTVTTSAGASRTIPAGDLAFIVGAFTHVTAFTCDAVFALKG